MSTWDQSEPTLVASRRHRLHTAGTAIIISCLLGSFSEHVEEAVASMKIRIRISGGRALIGTSVADTLSNRCIDVRDLASFFSTESISFDLD
jgi:hypothetical protein